MRYDEIPDALDRDLLLEFFWLFSIFECALKREGFLKVDRHGGARPDWKEFGRAMRGRFEGLDDGDELRQAVHQLARLAPHRQVVTDGRLDWEALSQEPDESDEQFVLRLVRTTRNNLFHGGKYPDGPIEEIARNRSILEASLAVLNGFFELHQGLARWKSEAA